MKHSLLFFLFCLLTFSGCSEKYASESATYAVDMSYDSKIQPTNDGGAVEVQKIIKRGSITFETTSAANARRQIDSALVRYKGFVESEVNSSVDKTTTYSLTVRVPADNFDALIAYIADNAAKRVTYRNVSQEDVTAQYIDTEARLKTKKELKERYIALLARANKVSDMLEIEQAINTHQEDIESTEAVMRYLNKNVDFSTLSISYTDQSSSFWSQIGDAFSSGWDAVLAFIVGLAHAWAFILLFAVAVWFVAVLIKKRRRNRKN